MYCTCVCCHYLCGLVYCHAQAEASIKFQKCGSKDIRTTSITINQVKPIHIASVRAFSSFCFKKKSSTNHKVYLVLSSSLSKKTGGLQHCQQLLPHELRAAAPQAFSYSCFPHFSCSLSQARLVTYVKSPLKRSLLSTTSPSFSMQNLSTKAAETLLPWFLLLMYSKS